MARKTLSYRCHNFELYILPNAVEQQIALISPEKSQGLLDKQAWDGMSNGSQM